MIGVGLILAGGTYLAYMYVFRRDILDHEPGMDDAVAPAPEVTT